MRPERPIEETPLPGVGIRYDFATAGGDRIGMIVHHSGRRDLLVYDRRDPDACQRVVRLDDEEVRVLADLLGALPVTENLTNLRQTVDGLTIDWLPIRRDWACAGCTIAGTGLLAETGVQVVAVVRDGHMLPSPGPDFTLQAGDTAVVIGEPEAIRAGFSLLQGR